VLLHNAQSGLMPHPRQQSRAPAPPRGACFRASAHSQHLLLPRVAHSPPSGRPERDERSSCLECLSRT